MRSQKGVTLIALIITIVVLSILIVTITTNVDIYNNQNERANFESDMKILKEEVNQYYAREKKLPIINKYNTEFLKSIIPGNVININDNKQYYVIDLDKINLEQFSVEISYGRDFEKIKERSEEQEITAEDNLLDVYVINEQSHTIYYPKGIEYNGEKHYTLMQEYTNMQNIISYMKDNNIKATANVQARDEYGNKVVIPEGFKIAEDSGLSVEEGIVIEDYDIKTGIGNDKGNQYVWVPVGNVRKLDGTIVNIKLGRYDFADGTSDTDEEGNVLKIGTPILKQNAEKYLEEVMIDSYYKELSISRPGVSSAGLDGENATALDLKRFIDSVNENGGYYIARYEASYGVDEKANSKVSNNFNDSNVAPTNEGYLWNNITQINAAIVSRNLYTTINSDLINSYAWDTAIVYIQAFSGNTDYSWQNSKNTSLSNTGVNQDEVCKIHDMASNAREWTTEYYAYSSTSNTYPCTIRGGYCYNSACLTKHRYNGDGTFRFKAYTFRTMLYL